MAAPGLGTRAGTMHIRVLPDTTNFKRTLKNKIVPVLKRIEDELPSLTVHVDKVRVSRAKIKTQIQAELNQIRDLVVDVRATVDSKKAHAEIAEITRDRDFQLMPEIDRVMLDRIRRDVQRSLERIDARIRADVDSQHVREQVNQLMHELDGLQRDLNISVLSEDEKLRIRRRIHDIDEALDDMAEDRTVHVDVNPFTAWASARLAWLTRPRFVEIIPRVSKTAITKALTALSALSGARLSWNYLDRFMKWIEELDKKLPRLTFGTLGLTTAFSALMASLSGIVGIGDGLAATLPSLLLVPGLMAGAVMSGVALFVALKDAKEELGELGDSYTNLGRIIKESFWGVARDPIIEFSNSIMPQLERSFEKTSLAIGRFTAKLAGSFQAEFAGGRLEAMFDGLAASWDELAKGTDAFAGAVTNLGLVAARYMPRLARWFVRQADTFDNWLSDVATDGRLDQWIEEAIDSFYALWDVMAATTGIFQGLWKAAEAAGSKGLRGFADMLLAWEKAIHGARWQETLTAMFRGAGRAMDGFGDGLERVGIMLHELREPIEYLMGEAGQTLGEFIGDIADALSSPVVAQGIRDFIDGVSTGLERFAPALEPMADAFGDLAGLVGDLVAAFGEPLESVFTTASSVVSTFVDQLRTHNIPERLAEAFDTAVDTVSPMLDRLAESLGGVVDGATDLVETALPELAEAIAALEPVLDPLLRLVEGLAKLAAISMGSGTGLEIPEAEVDKLRSLAELDGIDPDAFITTWTMMFQTAPVVQAILDWVAEVDANLAIARDKIINFPSDAAGAIGEAGAELMRSFERGIQIGFVTVAIWLAGLQARVSAFFAGAVGWLVGRGSEVVTGFRDGFNRGYISVAIWLAGMPARVSTFFAGAGTWLIASGAALLQGFADGVRSKVESVAGEIAAAVERIRGLFPSSPAKWGPFSGRGWVSYSGEAVGKTFGDSIVKSLGQARQRVHGAMAGIQTEFTSLTPGIDVSAQFDSERAYSAHVAGRFGSSGSSGPKGDGMTVNATFMQPEQRDQLRELTATLDRIRRMEA